MCTDILQALRKIAATPIMIAGDPSMLSPRPLDKHIQQRNRAAGEEQAALKDALGNNPDGSDRSGLDITHAKNLADDNNYLRTTYPATEEQTALGIPFDMSRASKGSPERFKRFIDSTQRLYNDQNYMDKRRQYEKLETEQAIAKAVGRLGIGQADSNYTLGDDFKDYYNAAVDDDPSNDSAVSDALVDMAKRYGSWDNYKSALEAKRTASGENYRTLSAKDVQAEWAAKHGRLASLRRLKEFSPLLKGYNYDVDGLVRDAKSANWVRTNQNNPDIMLTDEGRAQLENSNRLLQNKGIAEWARTNPTLSPEMRNAMGLSEGVNVKQLFDENAGKAQWALNNFDSLRDMNQMRKSPFMWLLSALFSRDPSRLYRALGGLNKMFDSKADAYWDTMGESDKFKSYRGWMPFLRMIHNLRYGISGGKGYDYLTY